MCKDKKDCGCKHHHGHHHHPRYSSIIKRTSEKIEIPSELLEVAEIQEGDFFEVRVHRVLKPSERKKHHHKNHKKE